MRLFIKIQGITVTFVFIYSFVMISSGQDRKSESALPDKEVFTAGYPRSLSFRNDNLGNNQDYTYWENMHLRFNSITKKYLREEGSVSPVIAQLANSFVEKNPGKLMLLHFNGESRSIKDEVTHEMFYPGHWVYEAGTTLAGDIGQDQTIIRVQSAQPFSETAYNVYKNNENVGKLPHNLIIVEVDQDGNRLWDQSEYATIEKVNYGNNTITVKRGQYFSTPRNFSKGNTFLAPLAGVSWGGTLEWYYNLSTACPVDQNGKTCSDVLVNEMVKYFSVGGILENIDGIGFDVNYFSCTQNPAWDVNNDGVADKGLIQGKNVWRLGDWKLLKDLRAALGTDFILTSDGWKDEEQRAVGVFNGMESEGLCKPNDGYRQISRTINQQTYWSMHNSTVYKFSYITSKLNNDLDATLSTQLHRMGLGVATCLGVVYAYDPTWVIPEVNGGSLNQNNWLGQPVSEIIYPVQQTADLLSGKGVTITSQLTSMFDFTDAEYRVEDNTLYIKGKESNPYTNLSVPGPSVILPQDGDLIVFFEAKAVDGFYDFLPSDLVPRKINIKINATPAYNLPGETQGDINMKNDLAGFMGTPGFTPLNYYFRKVGKSGTPVRLTFEVEEQGEFAIRNLRIYTGPCTMAREFQNGVVMVNPSYDNHVFNLGTLFPGEISYRRILAVRAESGFNLDGGFNEQVAYNNGAMIPGNSVVTVPPLNALFLVRDIDPSNINENDITEGFILYPNPCNNGSVRIRLPDGIKPGRIGVTVADINNRLLLTKQFTGEGEISMDVSGLMPGIYYFNIASDTFFSSKKLVIN